MRAFTKRSSESRMNSHPPTLSRCQPPDAIAPFCRQGYGSLASIAIRSINTLLQSFRLLVRDTRSGKNSNQGQEEENKTERTKREEKDEEKKTQQEKDEKNTIKTKKVFLK